MHDVQIQNNTAFEFMRQIPDLVRYDGQFCPFTDVGIFGHFFQGSSRYTQEMSYLGAILPEILSEYLTDEEVTRAKNLAFNEMMGVETVSDSI